MSADEDAYARSLGRVACAQIIYAQAERLSDQSQAQKSKGTSKAARPVSASNVSATESVADALADICGAFVQQIGRAAKARAELAARSKANLIDVLAALGRTARVTKTYTRDLAQYAMFEEIPFPHKIPEFPALPPSRKRSREVAFSEAPRERGAHIEPWMPELPSVHTYVSTPVYVAADARKRDRTDLGKQRRQVEKSLAKLKESQGVAAARSRPMLSENPFLAPPQVGTGRAIDEDWAGEEREPTEPMNDAEDAKDSNANAHQRSSHESEAKRARVERILAEAGGGATAVPAAMSKSDKNVDGDANSKSAAPSSSHAT